MEMNFLGEGVFMLNKNILIILFISFVVILVSCSIGRRGLNINTKVQDIQESADKNSSSNNNNQINLENSSIKNYEIIKGSYVKKNIKINYPQITNFSDVNKQKMVNYIIKKEAVKVLNYYQMDYDELSLEINYDIKWKGLNLLSIQYSGIGNVKGAAHPSNIFYTTNINIYKGSKLRLKDFVKIDESFLEKFKNGQFKALRLEHKGLLNNFNNADLIKELNRADSLDNIGTENQSDIFSYFTKNGLGISVSVVHGAGDHAEFEIKYDDIINNIKSENEIWKDFFNAM